MKNRLIEKEIDNNRLIKDLEEMVSIPSIVGEEEKLANFLYEISEKVRNLYPGQTFALIRAKKLSRHTHFSSPKVIYLL